MRTIWTAFLVLSFLGVAAGCERQKPALTEPAPVAPAPNPVAVPKPPTVPAKPLGTFTVGKVTTFVTGPLNKSGHIDYATALNERLSDGVTPQNNANVLIWKAIGPNPSASTRTPPGMFDKLGMPAPPADGEYFIDIRSYMEKHVKAGSGETGVALVQQLRHQPWKGTDQPVIINWLKVNEKPLALMIEATNRTHYYSPLIPERDENGSKGLITSLLPSVQGCREPFDALLVRAMLATGQGQLDDAWKDLLACHRLAWLVGRGGTLMEALVGLAIDIGVCRMDVIFLAHTQPDAKRLEGYLRDLQSLPALPNAADKLDFNERVSFLDSLLLWRREGFNHIEKARREGVGPSVTPFLEPLFQGLLETFDWDPVLVKANKSFDRLAEILREKDRAERVRKLQQFTTELQAMKTQAVDRERIKRLIAEGKEPGEVMSDCVGDALIPLLMPAFDKVQNLHERTVQTRSNVILAFALGLYHRENSKYPDSLDAVVPKYLPKMLGDLFSGKALIYRSTGNGYLLYSVGPNGTDDGGHDHTNEPPGDDLVVRMQAR